MTSIFDRYGIKEVADVVFLEYDESGVATKPVLFLDTLKISTIETTAEQTEARGGKGNAPLIIWDYGKEITVTLQDAVYSPKSMAMMVGDNNGVYTADNAVIERYKNIISTGADGKSYKVGANIEIEHGFMGSNKVQEGKVVAVYDQTGKVVADNGETGPTLVKGQRYIVKYSVTAKKAAKIEINAGTFPGTYKVVGDTYARSDTTGQDEFFQFIIHKAKMSSENTITLEAEGDSSVFDMNLRVMRPDNGKMMELIQYDLSAENNGTEPTWQPVAQAENAGKSVAHSAPLYDSKAMV